MEEKIIENIFKFDFNNIKNKKEVYFGKNVK
jgi:hypothetical protein